MLNHIYPTHIQIETIYGACTAKCIMCTINEWGQTKTAQTMNLNNFELLLNKLNYLPNQEYLTLHGLGEPLLDNELPQKISLAKKMNFHGVGFASNCTELYKDKALALLDSGLDTLICSIDGINKKTHESIRIGTCFEKVVNNVKNFIKLRNSGLYNTRIMLRFIRQDKNRNEFNEYCKFWNKYIDTSKSDRIMYFDVHNWGGSKPSKQMNMQSTKKEYNFCHDLATRLYIGYNGNLRFCCADDRNFYNLGNAFKSDPIVLWNSGEFKKYREAMSNNELLKMKYCKFCSIISSRHIKDQEKYPSANTASLKIPR